AEAIALSDTQGWPFYLGPARAYPAAALGASGAGPGAVAEASAGMSLVAAGAPPAAPVLNALAAGGAGAAGGPQGGFGAGGRGRGEGDEELEGRRGQVPLGSRDETQEDAERLYRGAAGIAGGQGAKALELRAAPSRARLLRDQGRPAEARALLAPIYGWFTE